MTAAQVKGAMGPTSFAEMARLSGEFADWHNLLYKATWLTGELNLDAVRHAWRRLCLRHDVMRRSFVSADEAFTSEGMVSEVEFHTADSDAEGIELMGRILGTPFSLDSPGFSRIAVVQRSERRHLLGIAVDHIISDQISWARIRGDFAEFYNRALVGDTDDVAQENTYQNFAAQQRSRFAGAWGEERRAFWHSYAEEFGTYPPRFQVGAEHRGEPKLRVVTRDLPADAKARVHAFSLEARATPFAVTSASVLAGMREVTGDPLVGISTNQHGRMLPGTSQTVGLFVQTVPLHLGLEVRSPLETVREVFLRTHDVFECSLPLRVAGRYWNEDLMVPDQEPGLYMALNEDLPSSADLPPLTGTEAEYADLDIKGGKRWPETVVVEWNLYETGPRLSAYYNENYFPGAAVEQLLEAAERFALPDGNGTMGRRPASRHPGAAAASFGASR
ncbi:condensation domain-containing protein [Streptomyces sp. WM6372]|uniref:condensation domain-containing protein n=1 Tax=Streptomyces sp. WM6372 TaxID=1415555 RepID=UPI0007C72437|nr:condensation domain-containing protein [Streptomyces sp. WM6372]